MQISKRSRLNFIEFASALALRDIRRIYESEHFTPAPAEGIEESGERRTLAARYDALIDSEDEEQAERLARVYRDAVTTYGREPSGGFSSDARRLIESLQEDEVPIDDEGRLVPGARRRPAPRRRDEVGDRLFISHAAADVDLAEALVELLRLGTDLKGSDIFLSSLAETGVPPGRDFVDYIRDELTGAALVLQLITPAFFESAFCLCELGVQWGMELPGYPLLVPPIEFGHLAGVLGQVQTARINDATGLDGLYDRVREVFALDPPTAGWSRQKDRFLGRLPELLADLAQAEKVDRRVHEDVLADLEAFHEARDRALTEVEELRQKIEELAQAKDADQVASILSDDDLAQDFTRLVEEAEDLLRPLPSIVCEALFHRIAGLPFAPSPPDDDGVDREIANGRLQRDDWTNEVEVNTGDPPIRRALTVLRQLSDFVPDDGLERRFEREHDIAFDFTSRRMWEALELLERSPYGRS